MKLEVVPLPMNGDFVFVFSEITDVESADLRQFESFKRDTGARAVLATSEPVEVVR